MRFDECIFIDESGRIGLNSKHPYFVVAYVYCQSPSLLKEKLKKYLNYLHNKDKYPFALKELKFTIGPNMLSKFGYTNEDTDRYISNMPSIRSDVIEITRLYCDGIIAAK